MTAIRLATIEDAAEIGRLLSPLGYPLDGNDVGERWKAWTAEGDFALVAPGESGLLGVITLHRMFVLHRPMAVGRITSLAVDPPAQGRGIGRALIQAGEAAMVGRGCGLMEVTSHARRDVAHSFYLHVGYEQTSFRFAKALEAP